MAALDENTTSKVVEVGVVVAAAVCPGQPGAAGKLNVVVVG